jgi:CMP-N-acetylneuraminic acid synthetase
MKNIKDILFIIQARLNSQRLPNKMLKPFKGSNLFGMAMTKVLLSDYIPKENFYVSVHEQELIDEANKLGVNVFKRSHESANNDNDLRKIYEWHDKLPFKYVIKINGCSPLLKIDTINEFTRQFVEQDEESLFGVIEQKDYFWNKEGLMITPWPEDQTIMNTKAVEPTYKAAHVLYASRMDIIKDYMFMGNFFEEGSIKLFPMNEVEAFDIDYEWQFKLAEKI